MPWNRESPMDQKIRLIGDWLSGDYTKAQLSRIFGISRPTVDKWINRYAQFGEVSLKEHSKAPRHHPNQKQDAIVERLIAEKLKRPHWGPVKLVSRLAMLEPEVDWPAPSTAGEWLKKAGLVRSRKLRRRTPSYSDPFKDCDTPNKVWSIDYKGQFRLQNGAWSYPLTMSDNCSRYVLLCQSLQNTRYQSARGWIEWVFREYGLPQAIRSDNGSPFASTALGGLSKLSVWWVKLGVVPERIEVGRPDQNGRHERMHKSLKEMAVRPPKRNHRAQQRAFDAFVKEFNEERPHESLGMKTPADCHQISSRVYPEKIPEVEYEEGYTVRRVRHNGEIKWRGEKYYVSDTLAKEPVALKENEEGGWDMYFSFLKIGTFDEKRGRFVP